jgi:hypothetical protein
VASHQALGEAAKVEIVPDEERRASDYSGVVAEQQTAEPAIVAVSTTLRRALLWDALRQSLIPVQTRISARGCWPPRAGVAPATAVLSGFCGITADAPLALGNARR